ncbi:hypothetical protein LTR86_008619 [Recurvomyces mirabilis]|nr:hypothetical protein LTR86_008619 [Recurvomyces mirabilis]
MGDPTASLIEAYHDLNANVVDEPEDEPSALEFMRYVANNRPFVVRKAAIEWQAFEKWDAAHLRKVMAGEDVKVAITPSGNADAVVRQEDARDVFVEPYEIEEPFGSFLDAIQDSSGRREVDKANVRYAQTQNDNLRNEYSPLQSEVPSDISFARIALEQPADAINLWLGNDRSVTSLHKDNYENIYVQIRGQKHFTILPPVEMGCVNERLLPKGRYAPDNSNVEENTDSLVVKLDTNAEPVPVATWDPDTPEENTTRYSHLAKPLRVTLQEGDMFYLPSLWYHKVSQTVGEEGFVCAVNYWYDMDFTGQHWVGNQFVRDVYQVEQKNPDYPGLVISTEG